jgi:hypothetical protein
MAKAKKKVAKSRGATGKPACKGAKVKTKQRKYVAA